MPGIFLTAEYTEGTELMLGGGGSGKRPYLGIANIAGLLGPREARDWGSDGQTGMSAPPCSTTLGMNFNLSVCLAARRTAWN